MVTEKELFFNAVITANKILSLNDWRFKLIIEMFNDFPVLRQRIKEYLGGD